MNSRLKSESFDQMEEGLDWNKLRGGGAYW